MNIIHQMNLNAVDLNLLTAFNALMEHRHVTQAGQAIGLSQPAMSNALSRLRALFDDQLLVRTPEGMTPTPRALELHAPIRQALAQISGALNGRAAFDPANTERTFTIAMAEDAAFLLLPRLKARIGAEAPGISVHVQTTTYIPGVELIEAEECEFSVGMVPGNVPKFVRSLPLYSESLICIARKGHPVFAGDFTLDDFLAYPHVAIRPSARARSRVDMALSMVNRERKVAVTVPHMLIVPFLLPNTDLIGALAQRIARHFAPLTGLETRPIPVDVPGYDACLTWHQRFDDDPAHAWMRSVIAEIAGGI